MIRRLMSTIASWLRRLANWVDPHVRDMRRIPTPEEIEADRKRREEGDAWMEKHFGKPRIISPEETKNLATVVLENETKKAKERMKQLLAKDELTPDETKELAALTSQFEGGIIFLDDPVGAEKEHL